MKVVKAPEYYETNDVRIFLAGGITNCPEWQKEVEERLENVKDGVLYNPRRDNFPIGDPSAATEQITWEFYQLMNADIIAIWFSDGLSDQPIAMYELGRYFHKFENNTENFIIGVHSNYNRATDVYTQIKLANEEVANRITDNLKTFSQQIGEIVKQNAYFK